MEKTEKSAKIHEAREAKLATRVAELRQNAGGPFTPIRAFRTLADSKKCECCGHSHMKNVFIIAAGSRELQVGETCAERLTRAVV